MTSDPLGYALKDKQHPDYATAEVELSRAIGIRGPAREHGWPFYELNRAICRIMLDPARSQQLASGPDTYRAILEDLQVAMRGGLEREIGEAEPIKEWMERNGVKAQQLR